MAYTKLMPFLAFGLLTSVPSAFAFFKVPCSTPLVIERVDPIISPGEVSSHVHTVMGGSAFGFDMDYAMTQTSGCNSCSVVEDKSNYWIAALYYHAENNSFIRVPQNGGALMYYQQRPDPETNGPITAFPEGFRMIAGNPFYRSDRGDIAASAKTFACLNYDAPGTPQTKHFPKTKCPNGVRVQIYFPSCWDGVNVDSDNHHDHVAYPTQTYDNGPCPETHPVRLISVFYEITWHTEMFDDMWYSDEQPFVFSFGDPTGYGLHADFLNGWDVEVLQEAIDTCNDEGGDINECGAVTLQPNSVTDGCILERSVHEDVDNVLDTLPGCNPISAGPEDAEPVTGCGATDEIGTPIHYYKDMTAEGWAWMGCTVDSQASRVLTGASTNADDLTIESCLQFCGDGGFSIAGVENANECFCGDSVAEESMPKVTPMGNCLSPCTGDASENCGGHGFLGLYKECSSDCTNLEYPPVPR